MHTPRDKWESPTASALADYDSLVVRLEPWQFIFCILTPNDLSKDTRNAINWQLLYCNHYAKLKKIYGQ